MIWNKKNKLVWLFLVFFSLTHFRANSISSGVKYTYWNVEREKIMKKGRSSTDLMTELTNYKRHLWRGWNLKQKKVMVKQRCEEKLQVNIQFFYVCVYLCVSMFLFMFFAFNFFHRWWRWRRNKAIKTQ